MPKMSQSTPYGDRPKSERDRELACMRAVLSVAPEPTIVYEAFGGIGMTAELMTQLWPQAWIHSWDLDANCVEQYAARKLANATIHHGDTLQSFDPPLSFDAASLDYNKCTIRDLENRKSFQFKLIREVADANPRWIELTNSAIGKLHLNWRSYGLSGYDDRDQAQAEYVRKLDTWARSEIGYTVTQSAHHSAASYHLLERTL